MIVQFCILCGNVCLLQIKISRFFIFIIQKRSDLSLFIQIDKLSKIYLGRPVLEEASASIESCDRIGLIGGNGAGKTTLLRLIANLEMPDEGNISGSEQVSIGYLAQKKDNLTGESFYSELSSAFAPLKQLQHTAEKLSKQLSAVSPDSSEYQVLSQQYASVQTEFEQRGGYQMEVKLRRVQNGMGFAGTPDDAPVANFSGGEKTRLELARLLLQEPDLLLLDEPTNYLDFSTLTWLEEYLSSYPGAFLVVSHDRLFLDRCVQKIWEISAGRLTVFSGNYSHYWVQKKEQRRYQAKQYQKQNQKVQELKEYIAKNKSRASTAKMAHSRERMLSRMEPVAKPPPMPMSPRFQFVYDFEPTEEVLSLTDFSVSVGVQRTLFEHLSLTLRRGERWAVIGPNGSGKSSLIRAILGEIPASGRVRWGQNVTIGYYRQELDQFRPENTLLEELWHRYPTFSEHTIRSLLAQVCLTGDNVMKKVCEISGGEKAKLAFALLMLQKPNVLILDEPTNHLDLPTREALEEALNRYTGTILFITHDRYLLQQLPTYIITVSDGNTELFHGNFTQLCNQKQEEEAVLVKTDEKKPTGKVSAKQQRAERAKQRQAFLEMEKEIEQTEEAIVALEQEITTPAVYEDHNLLEQSCTELAALREKLDQLLSEWVS